MHELRTFTYTDAKGKVTNRTAIVMAEPYPHYRMLDVSELGEDEVNKILETLFYIDEERSKLMDKLTKSIGQNVNYMWRSFKKENIEWDDE